MRIDALDQCDAERFRLGARRAVVGPLAPKVGLDRARTELAERHPAFHDARLDLSIAGIQNRDRRVETRGLAAQCPKLPHGIAMVSRLVHSLWPKGRDLVGSDNERIRKRARKRARLVLREPQGGYAA